MIICTARNCYAKDMGECNPHLCSRSEKKLACDSCAEILRIMVLLIMLIMPTASIAQVSGTIEVQSSKKVKVDKSDQDDLNKICREVVASERFEFRDGYGPSLKRLRDKAESIMANKAGSKKIKKIELGCRNGNNAVIIFDDGTETEAGEK